MKYLLLKLFPLLFMVSNPCNNYISTEEKHTETTIKNSQMIIKIGNQSFTATLENNATAAAFTGMLPLSINMIELNGNEKYYQLKQNLPVKSFNPQTIQNGDLMIYGSNTLVIFYKTFSTPYSYTKLGRIDDTAGLAKALGTGDIKVSFELK